MELPRINGHGTNGHAARSSAPNGVNGSASPPSVQPTKIFVGGISAKTNVQMLRVYFGDFGVIADVTVPINNDTKRHQGFGFVTFNDTKSVDGVMQIQEQKGHFLDGKNVECKRAVPKNDPSLKAKPAKRKAHTFVAEREEPQPNKVFIGGVDGSTSAEDIRKYFEKMGEVRDVELKWDNETGRHRGFGFVTFANEDCAKKAVDGRHHKIGPKYVECKAVRPKAELAAEKSVEPHSQLSATAQQFVPMQQHPGFVPPAAAADFTTQFYDNLNALTAAQQQGGGLSGQHYRGAGPAWTPADSYAGAVGGAGGGYGVQPTPPPASQEYQGQWLTTFGGSQDMLSPPPPAANGHHAMSAAGNGFGMSLHMFQLPATSGNLHTNAVNSQASSAFVGSPMTIGTWQPQMANSPPVRAPTMMYAASAPSQTAFNVPSHAVSSPESPRLPAVNPAMAMIQNIGFSFDAQSKGGKASNGFPPVSKNL